jgi:hypothetical protein
MRRHATFLRLPLAIAVFSMNDVAEQESSQQKRGEIAEKQQPNDTVAKLLKTVIITTALFGLVALSWQDHAATYASQPQANAEGDKDSVSGQLKELQKQVMALQKQVVELQKQVGEPKPRIVAAGTATWTCPDLVKNTKSTRVQLPRDVVAGLGKDYIVLLTNRLPSGYPYFVPHWKLAPDGFDITPVDTTVSATTPAGYGVNRTYLIDWVVVKK